MKAEFDAVQMELDLQSLWADFAFSPEEIIFLDPVIGVIYKYKAGEDIERYFLRPGPGFSYL